MEFGQITGLLLDVGLGALAYNLARSLKAVLADVVKIQKDHEKRITELERKVP